MTANAARNLFYNVRRIIMRNIISYFLISLIGIIGCATSSETTRYTEYQVDIKETKSTITDKGTQWGDGRIEIRVEKLERMDAYPDELKSPGYRYLPPKKGHNFVVIRFEITNIENVHVVGLGGRSDEQSSIYGAKGQKHKASSWSVKGVKFLEGLKGPFEFVNGTTGILLFEYPQNEKPMRLSLVYYFKETMKEKIRKMGIVDIDLPGYPGSPSELIIK